ncbi:MAG: OmpA family protein, partial [Moraxellaceae bacterium]|nr:OmpA family protein [Moraxellaceae bacterium]
MFAAFLGSGLLTLAVPASAAIVNNTATAAYIDTTVGGAGSVVVSSNTTTLNTVPPPTPSVVTFYQFVPSLSSGRPGNVFFPFDGSQYDDGGIGNFQFLPGPLDLSGSPVSLAGPVEVRPTRVFHVGEPVFITLADGNRNTDPTVREYIEVRVTTWRKVNIEDRVTVLYDTEILRLLETGPNTGIFAAVVQSTRDPATSYDGSLSLDTDTQIRVNYQDIYYPTDVSQAQVLVDPFGVVFDSDTGAPIDGATVTILTADGQPVRVFGDDGASCYPSTVVTGVDFINNTPVPDCVGPLDGQLYDVPKGGFRFPFVAPGNYRFVVTPPAGYTVPSTVTPAELQANPATSIYAIETGSYTDVFEVLPGPALNIDIPADPSGGGLFLQKLVSQNEASAGDFLQYRLVLRNVDALQSVSNVQILDVLPEGMRYRAGSLYIGGVKQTTDPVIQPDGRTMLISVGALTAAGVTPGDSVQVTYVVQLSAGVVPGRAVNTANAVGDSDLNPGVQLTSNRAQVAVQIREPLFSGRFTIIGRVYEGGCAADWSSLKGVPNVRVMMEDGTYVITDKDGQYHFEAVRPGTHVVQIDTDTLPKGYEPQSCIDNTRFAGNAISQFVDVKGGGLWRADFHTRAPVVIKPVPGKPVVAEPGKADVGIRMSSRLDVDTITIAGAPPVVKKYNLSAEFDSCRATLKPQGEADVERLARDLAGQTIERIELIGNTDNQRLSPRCQQVFKDNQVLSEARAQTVGDALQRLLNLTEEQIVTRGQGETVPVAPNNSAANMARNRRTEVIVQSQAKGAVAAKTEQRVRAMVHRIELDGAAPVDTLKVMAMLPAGNRVVPGSVLVDGLQADAPEVVDGLATFTLGKEARSQWQRVIEFRTLPQAPVRAPVPVKTAPAKAPRSYTVRAQFDSCSEVLQPDGEVAVARLVAELRGRPIERIELVGHSDSQRPSARCMARFKDNYKLSEARAQTVGNVLASRLGLEAAQIVVTGRGADEPVASNATAAGMASNRRTEVKVYEGREGNAPVAAGFVVPDESRGPTVARDVLDSCTTALQQEGWDAAMKLSSEWRGRAAEIAYVEFAGHTDNQPLNAYCQAEFNSLEGLSKARAQVLAESVAMNLGLKPEQVRVLGEGDASPVADNANPDERLRNNRIEVRVVKVGAASAPAAAVAVPVEASAPVDTSAGADAAASPAVPVADLPPADLVVYRNSSAAVAAAAKREAARQAEWGAVPCKAESWPLKALASFQAPDSKRAQTPAVETELACPGAVAASADAAQPLRAESERKAVTVTLPAVAVKPVAEPAKPVADGDPRVRIVDSVEASGANIDFVQGQKPGMEWLFPGEKYNPRAPATRIAIKHAPGHKVVLTNAAGDVISPLNFDGTSYNADRTVAVSVWRGVPLVEGRNLFTATVTNARGDQVGRFTGLVHYSNTPVRAELVSAQSVLVADGRSRPVLAVRLLDRDGKPVRDGVTGPLEILAPYQSQQQAEFEQKRQLAGLDRFQPQYRVQGDEGIAYIELAPTTDSGMVQANFTFQTGQDSTRRQEIRAWVEPHARDWVVVGFAEGTVGYNTLKDNVQPLLDQGIEEGGYADGQISLYAKGRVLGKWLMTMAFDSDKSDQRDRQQSLLGVIDPGQYYTLYGDGTGQRQDAPSQDNLYLKLERGQFYALFGDYETGLNQTQLMRYSRTLNGIKSEKGDGRVRFNVFVSETPQNYARDERQGNGTSGLYRLSQTGIVLNSEKIRIETRDRLQSQNILQSRTLIRHLDYDIDYRAGTLFFREPIPSRDTNFNPIFIIAEYETLGVASEELNAGGRVALHTLDDRVAVGVSAIRDENQQGATSLAGVDVKVKVGLDSEFRLEFASSDGQQGLLSPSGSAFIAEYEHHSAAFDLLAYARQQEEGFGKGQQNVSEAGQQKMGVEVRRHLDANWSLKSHLYAQDNLVNDNSRIAGMAGAEYKNKDGGFNFGVQSINDEAGSGALAGQTFRSDQITAGANRYFFNRKLELSAQGETSLGTSSESVDFPDRYTLGAGYMINDHVRMLAAQEFTEGSSFDTTTSRVGFQVVPWKGARLDSTLNQSQMSEYGPRTFGQFGLTQAVLLNSRW